MKRLRAIDLCCGAGGWACAARGLPIDIEVAVDFWDAACKTYSINNPGTHVLCADLGNPATIQTVTKLAKGVDLLLGAIPCQWLSQFRKLVKVTDSERERERRLLDSILGLVRTLSPQFWCLEDVEQLIDELPILTPYVKINARQYSGQRRKRVFVGDFPAPPAGRDARVLRDYVRPGPYRIGRRAFDRTPVTSRSFNGCSILAGLLDRKAPTMTANGSRRDGELALVDENLPGGKRQIEWQESASLQGFPSDYVFFGSPSDTEKMVGGAIQIDTGRAILSAIVAAAGKQRVKK